MLTNSTPPTDIIPNGIILFEYFTFLNISLFILKLADFNPIIITNISTNIHGTIPKTIFKNSLSKISEEFLLIIE